MDDLRHRPRWVYTDATSAVDYHALLPQRPWSVGTASVGGSDASAAGVPAAFQIRRDSLWRLTLRFREREWGNVERLIAHLQGGGSVTFYPDRLLSESHAVYGVSPAMGEEVIPRPSDEPSVQEIDITVRPTTSAVVRRPYYGRALWRFSAGDDARRVTFTRTGAIGARRNFDRNLEQAAANVLRTNWRLVNGVLRPYTLLERPGTNSFQRSEEMNDAYWTKSGSSVVANQRTGPGGLTSLDELVEDSGTSNHIITRALTGVTANASYAYSRFFRAGARTRVMMKIQDTVTPANFAQSFFDLTAGVADNGSAGGTGALVGAYVEDWGGGLYRCVVDGSVGNGVTAVTTVTFLVSTGTTINYAGDGASSVFTGHAQFEDNVREASSYIPTTTIAASREAESFTDLFPYTPRQLAAMGGGTLYLDFIEGLVPDWVAEGGNSRIALAIIGASGGSTPRLELYRTATGNDYFFLHNNGVGGQVSSSPNLTPTRDARVQLAAHFRRDGSVQMFGRLNNVTNATGAVSAAITPAPAWNQSTPLIRIGGGSSTAGRGIQEYAEAAWFPALLGIDECERELRAA